MSNNNIRKLIKTFLVCLLSVALLLLIVNTWSNIRAPQDNGIFVVAPGCTLIMGESIVMNENSLITDDEYREMLEDVLVIRAKWYKRHPVKDAATNRLLLKPE